MVQAFYLLFERLRPGGKYFIEDLHCSYWKSHGGGLRASDASIEWLKGLIDNLNADHFGAERLGTDLTWTRTINRDVARITFYDSFAIVEKLGTPKRAPYRRLLSGETAAVEDPALWFVTAPTADMATLLLGPTAARSIEGRVLDQVALLRDECGKCKAELAGHEEALAHSRRELASRDEALAQIRRELANREEALAQSRREAQLALASRDETLARLHANQSEFSLALAERDGKIDSLMQTLAERDGQIQRLKQTAAKRDKVIASLNQAVAERDRSRRALQAIRLSTSWRLTAPLRFVKRVASSLLRWFLKAAWISVRSFYRILPLSVRPKVKTWLFGSFPVLFAHSSAYRRWLVVTTDHTQRVASLSEKPLLVASVDPEMPLENAKRDLMHESAHRDDKAHTAEPADKSYNVLDIPYDLLVSPQHLLHDHEVCVFVTYSPTPMLCQPTLRYIEALRQSGMKVLLLTATDDLRAPANVNVNLLTGLIVRGNHGFDFAAWATALAILPDLWNARILVLANDSVYGPTSQSALNDVLDRIRQSTSEVIRSHRESSRRTSYSKLFYST